MSKARVQPPATKKHFRKDIQALRAFAVAAVVLYHLWPNRLEGGFTGVDIFFVISGFLMTMSVMGRLKPHMTARSITPKNIIKILTEFYARRIRRLVPAALFALSGTLVLAYLTNNLNIVVNTAKNVISSATFWENWQLARQSVDYLHAGDTAVATEHFWSLSLEEQFYLMWPLLLIGATLLTLNIVVYYKRQKVSGIILPITLLAMMSFTYGYWLTGSEPSVAYFSTPARIWELMLGGIIAFLPTLKSYDLKLLLPHIGLVMCLYSVFFITGEGFPGWHALIPTIGTAMIIWAGIGKPESKLSFDKLFSIKPIQWIGNISYSVYLWHFPLIILLPVLLHKEIDGEHGRLIKIGIIILSLIIAQISYRYVEETTRKVRLKTRYIYFLFILATGLVVGGGFALHYYGTKQVDERLQTLRSAAIDEKNICFGARAIINQDKCDDPYGLINSSFSGVNKETSFKSSILTGYECESFIPSSKEYKMACVFGDTLSDKTILIIGDSHAQQYVNAFDVIGKSNGYKVVLMNGVGCKSWWGIPTNDVACDKRLDYIKNSKYMKESSFIVLSFLFRDYESTRDFTLEIKNASTSPVILMKDNPKTTIKNFDTCNTYQTNCTIDASKATGFNDNISNKMVSSGIISDKNIVDLTDAFCDNDTCYQHIGGLPVYYNTVLNESDVVINSHLTPHFSYSLAPLILIQLRN